MGSFFRLDTFIFPRVATAVYWIGLIVIVIGTIVGVIGGLMFGGMAADPAMGAGDSLLVIVAALFYGLLSLLLWRLFIEFALVVFSIRDLLQDIRDNKPGL